VALLALVLVALLAGCETTESTRRVSSSSSAIPVATGGTLLLGLEDEPGCLDWIGTCGATDAGYWAANVTTVPRVFAVEPVGGGWAYEATNLVAEEPTLTGGDQPVATYRLSPFAVWSDGKPITSADFTYTWQQVVRGEGVADRSGYRDIESIDDSDPSVAVVTFAAPVGDWKSLFGGRVGLLPAHLLSRGDRAELMADGYTWSGGPWKITSWKKGSELTLVPNERYWGTKPKLDKVIFTFIPNGGEALQALKAKEVLGIYPRSDLTEIRALAARDEQLRAAYSEATLETTALAFNMSKPPFDNATVRQAIAFSLDRESIVRRPPQSFAPPLLEGFADTDAFAGYRQDLRQVETLLQSGGWRKDGDGMWVRRGARMAVPITVAAGDPRRDRIARLLVAQLRAAGFDSSIVDRPAAAIDKVLTTGDFHLVLHRFSASSLRPNSCAVWCSSHRAAAAGDAGAIEASNVFRVNDEALDRLFGTVATALDESVAAAASQEGDQMLADQAYVLPIEAVPSLLVTSTQVVGTIADNPVMGPFWQLHTWGLQ
jgi:peptide/nickel transport system substrate-binding protein